MKDIENKISEGREVKYSAKFPIDIYDHFTIHSDWCDTEEEAISEFWVDYENKEVPAGGTIYWRRMPEMDKEYSFDDQKHMYRQKCRFSITDI